MDLTPLTYVKMNCDGAVTLFGATAAARGFKKSPWLTTFGFFLSLRGVVYNQGEIMGHLMGIKLARINGYSRVMLGSDSLVAIKFIRDGCSSLYPSFNLVKKIQDLLRSEGDWTIVHTLREGNQVADSFAKFCLILVSCSRIFRSTPAFASLSIRA